MKDVEISSLSAIEHILHHRPDRIRRLLVIGDKLSPRVQTLCDRAKKNGISVERGRTKDRTFEPLKAWVPPFNYLELKELVERVKDKEKSLILALDHLQDPQNLGALCRTAEALGVDAVLLPKDRSVTVSPGAYHASVGAVETLPIAMANLSDGLRRLKEAGYWILGTTLGDGAKPPHEIPDFKKMVLVMGAELEGLSHGIANECDWKIEIPLTGHVQSLNVSVAGGILMHYLTTRLSCPSPSPEKQK